jgi:hypothetical protein
MLEAIRHISASSSGGGQRSRFTRSSAEETPSPSSRTGAWCRRGSPGSRSSVPLVSDCRPAFRWRPGPTWRGVWPPRFDLFLVCGRVLEAARCERLLRSWYTGEDSEVHFRVPQGGIAQVTIEFRIAQALVPSRLGFRSVCSLTMSADENRRAPFRVVVAHP